MYIVAWSLRDEDEDIDTDQWAACETLEEARAYYAAVLEDPNLYTASIAAVVESTDYTPPK